MIFKNWGKQKDNNRQTFDELYHQYASAFRGVCRRYAHSSDEADDILQEAYIKIYSKLHQLKDIKLFEAWGKRIVINTALQHIKENVKNRHQDIELFDFEISNKDEEQSLSYMSKLDICELVKLMDKLPEGYRTILNLYAVEGYSHKEIAEMLCIKEASSRSQYFKAKKAFQHILLANLKQKYGKFAI